MMATKSVNESYTRRTALDELKALQHKLMTGDIRIVISTSPRDNFHAI